MRLSTSVRSILLAGSAVIMLAACTQGEEIASPGASAPGTPPGGGSGGGTPPPGASGDTCPTGLTQGVLSTGQVTCDIAGTILTSLTLSYKDDDNDGVPVAYRLAGRVNIGEDVGADGSAPNGDPAVLTIEPGVTVYGESGADFLVVNRGSRIEADGTATRPIIMTSRADLEGTQADPVNAIGEWGGLVVLGRAPINRCDGGGTPFTVSCENVVEGVTAPEAQYGGGLAGDNSGTLRYLQVRFAGFPLASGNELNGITLAGVGTGTTVDFIQVHNNSDDGVEMFGGTVNLRHVVLTGNDDDSLDTDNGWNGNAQYVIVSQTPGRGDNGFEMSSAGTTVSPATNPTIANFTIVGSTKTASPGNGIRLNSGHIGRFLNGVVTDVEACFRWEDAGNGNATYDGVPIDPTFNSVIFDCVGGLERSTPDNPAAVASVGADANNVVGASTITTAFQAGPNETAPTATAADLTLVNAAFFDDTDYLGAFGPDETATNNWATGWTFNLFPDPTCPTGTNDTGTLNGVRVCELSGVVTNDTTLTRGNYYELSGRVDIGIDVGADGSGGNPAILTIEPGVSIFGNSGADFIVVNRGSQIFSNGTRQNPVIMTSENDLRGDVAPGNRLDTIGEWGGVVVLGRAPINRCDGGGTPFTISCENFVEGVTAPEAQYGGATANDNSGAFRFTAIKFAGFPLASGNELNGLTLAGVGSDTVVEYVQVHNNSDDGIEMFGGSANLKYIVLTGNDDDSLDTDNGWNGNAQFVIVKQRDGRGDNGFEMSSAGTTVSPATNPTIANFTIVGSTKTASPGNGIRLNSGHIGRFINGVVTDVEACFRWEDAGNGNATYDGLNVDPTFNNSLFDCVGGLERSTPDNPAAVASIAADATNTSSTSVNLINGFINDAAVAGRPEFTDLNGTVDAFFENTDYIGAVRDVNDDWWADWSCGLDADDC